MSAGMPPRKKRPAAATDAQVLEDAERLIAVWNERQAKRMPMLFSPTIGAAITAGYWFLWVRCPCRTTNAIDLRTLDRHRDAALSGLIPAAAHHDALEFPDGCTVLLTLLCEGQEATVLQLPARLTDPKRWSHFLRQPAKVDSPIPSIRQK
jgi:hypothetical protein